MLTTSSIRLEAPSLTQGLSSVSASVAERRPKGFFSEPTAPGPEPAVSRRSIARVNSAASLESSCQSSAEKSFVKGTTQSPSERSFSTISR